MRYFLMGCTGFIGEFLIEHLLQQGHDLDVLIRPQSELTITDTGITLVEGNALNEGPWQERAAAADVIVNLVGSTIMTRWTDEAKQRILDTRVLSTQQAVKALSGSSGKIFFCANAVGYYGDRGDELLTETSAPGEGFLTDVCLEWQEQALEAEKQGHRVVIGRFAPVLGPGGGMLDQMLTPFRLGLGGKIGNGKQWFPWVHVRDLVRFIDFAANNRDMAGPVNVCAPNLVTNATFTKTLARILKRPAFFTIPGFAIRLIYGEAAQAILSSTRCEPKVLLESAFNFEHPNLDEALEDILMDEE